MKKIIYLLAAIALFNFSSCKKSGTSPTKPKGTSATTMYPVSSTFVQTGGVLATYNYTYDSDNNMTKIASGNTYEVDITPHTSTQTSNTSEFDVVNTFAFSGPSNTPVDIYTDIPAQMSTSTYQKNNLDGSSTTFSGRLWAFQGSGGNITKMYTSDVGGTNIDFTYDANNNFKTISFTSLSGTRAGLVSSSMTVTAVDNHPSPFSAVKGYNVFSYNQGMYVSDYALAFCKNNPTQIIYQQFDYDTGAMATSEEDDFTYTYNAQGYPASMVVTVSYLGTNPSQFTKSYTYTYK